MTSFVRGRNARRGDRLGDGVAGEMSRAGTVELDVGTGDARAPDVDRVRGIGHQCHVAAIEDREAEVAMPFLRAHRRDDLLIGIETDVRSDARTRRHACCRSGSRPRPGW
jgi:hypothetical protein